MQIKVHTSPALQSWGVAVLRGVVGLVFVAHGLQKAFITGLAAVAGSMNQFGLPWPMAAAFVATAFEVVGGLALIGGFLTRWAAIPLGIEMLVAAALVHRPAGFFLPNGYEFALTLLAACAALTLLGSGACALDNVLPMEGRTTGSTTQSATKVA